jgi:hypothetical protein
VVDIEQRALRALEQDVGTRLVCLVKRTRHVGNHLGQARRHGHRAVQNLLKIDRLRAQVVLQREVVIVQHFTQLLGKTLGTQQVLQAQAAACHLVFVGWTDAAPGGADFLRALGRLAGDVKCLVVGQDQRAGFRNAKARIGIDSSSLELVEFLDQRLGREHHAVADIGT